MKPPAYTIENHAAVYDFYRDYTPHKTFTRNAYRLLHRIMQPRITYDECSRQELPELLQRNTPMIITLNHLSDRHDQWTSAAVASDVLPEKVGDIRVLAKSTFYTGELLDEMKVPRHKLVRSLAQRALTGFVNNMGTMPVYRPTDQSSEQRRLSIEAANSTWDTLGELLETGHPVAIYGEGTADTQDPRYNLPIKAGIGHLAIQTLQEGRPPGVIIPIGVSYPEYTERTNRKGKTAIQPSKLTHAHAHVGEIYHLQPDDTVRTIQKQTARVLQDATSVAFMLQQPRYLDADGSDISYRFQ